MQDEDLEGTESGAKKDVVEHANLDGSAEKKVSSSVDGVEDESVNERMDDVEIESSDGFRMKDGVVPMLIQTQG